ncbi:uncharacterized protein LOC122500848 [Leptopilina heterotoma]|uniref:uncharacterized protein LOC122500848 n=1 Tax=Leptopilina heterotoma TaxID=63436 RepID=UPI001CA9CBCE|nr:uncharacterized protein LOC122500848 [Leptopilina heterotoma]
MVNQKLIIALVLALANVATAGPLAAGICYAGCAGVVCACFAAAGVVFGTVPLSVIAATPALAGCNSAFATCMSLCSAAVIAPTP